MNPVFHVVKRVTDGFFPPCFLLVFLCGGFQSLLKRQGELENGTVWSNSSESSDDSSSPALAHPAQRLTASNVPPSTLSSQLSSTPSLSSNQEEDEPEGGEVFSQADPVPNGHPRAACGGDGVPDRAPAQPEAEAEQPKSAEASEGCPDASCLPVGSLVAVQQDAAQDSSPETAPTGAEDGGAEAGGGQQGEASSSSASGQLEDAAAVSGCLRPHTPLVSTAACQSHSHTPLPPPGALPHLR